MGPLKLQGAIDLLYLIYSLKKVRTHMYIFISDLNPLPYFLFRHSVPDARLILRENKQTNKQKSCKFPTAPERSIVCTETASSSGSRRSCAAIGQSGVEGGGLSSLLALLLPPPPPILSSSSSLPSWRTERCGDNRTQSRRRLHGGGDARRHIPAIITRRLHGGLDIGRLSRLTWL